MLYEKEHRNSRPNHWCLSLKSMNVMQIGELIAFLVVRINDIVQKHLDHVKTFLEFLRLLLHNMI